MLAQAEMPVVFVPDEIISLGTSSEVTAKKRTHSRSICKVPQ